MTAAQTFQAVFDRYLAGYRALDAAACASCYTADGEVFSPYGAPAKGRPAVEALHQEWLAEGGEDKAIEVLSAAVDGDLGWALARFTEGEGGDAGVSLNAMERGADGAWLIRASSLTAA